MRLVALAERALGVGRLPHGLAMEIGRRAAARCRSRTQRPVTGSRAVLAIPSHRGLRLARQTHACTTSTRGTAPASPPPRRSGTGDVGRPCRARNSSATRAMRRCLRQVTAAAPPPNAVARPAPSPRRTPPCRRRARRCRFRHAACGSAAQESRTRGGAVPAHAAVFARTSQRCRRPSPSHRRADTLSRHGGLRPRRATSASSACPRARPRAGRRGRRATRGWRRPPRSRAAAARALRSSISCSISSTGTGGCASSARRRLTTPSTRSMLSMASRHARRRPRPTPACASMAAFTSRTRSKIAASAPAVLRSLSMRRVERRRAPSPPSPSRGLTASPSATPSPVSRLQPRQEVHDPAAATPRPGPCRPR